MIPKEMIDEIAHLRKTGIPRCSVCKKDYVHAYDSIAKKISKYSWKPNCEHNKNGRISLG